MYSIHTDSHSKIVILCPRRLWGRALSVDREHLAAVLGDVAPVIAYAEDERGRVVFPMNPEGDRLARCLAAQLTLCAAGLWPTS